MVGERESFVPKGKGAKPEEVMRRVGTTARVEITVRVEKQNVNHCVAMVDIRCSRVCAVSPGVVLCCCPHHAWHCAGDMADDVRLA